MWLHIEYSSPFPDSWPCLVCMYIERVMNINLIMDISRCGKHLQSDWTIGVVVQIAVTPGGWSWLPHFLTIQQLQLIMYDAL